MFQTPEPDGRGHLRPSVSPDTPRGQGLLEDGKGCSGAGESMAGIKETTL